jgi:filamentous hemagglutinin
MASGAQTAVGLSMQAWPRETTAVLNFLAASGQAVDATLTYLDERTGQVVSSQWNSLSPETRYRLIGAGKVTGVVLSPLGVAQVQGAVTSAAAGGAVRARRVLEIQAQNALVGSGGMLDASGRPLLDMSGLSHAQKSLFGDLFGAHTVRQIVPDGVKIGRAPGFGVKGIDDLYRVNRPDVDYVVIEYKFVGDHARTGSSALKPTGDGRQGSLGWLLGSGRIPASVGREAAGSVELAARSGRIETWVVTTRPNGSTEIEVLDAVGRPKQGVDVSRIIPPRLNLSGARP